MSSSNIATTLSESDFWELIAKARKLANDDEQLSDELVKLLSKESEEKILSFGHIFEVLHNRSYKSDLWCTVYVACGGCSDDGFDYFRGWLIGRGKDVFYAAMSDPDSLLTEFQTLKKQEGFPENEMMLGVASSAYEEKTGKGDFYDQLEETGRPEPREELEMNWSEDDEDSMSKICPRVFKKFWHDPF
ncbi:MAG: DUF4240 domain-containing protein [Candidatus Obscuribacterales bacterium]|nr:DUF4240 domain-containing protein [Candidatus Obscuribacterales bacterium]